MPLATSALTLDLEEQIQKRTDRRVRNLAVEFRRDHVILRGQTPTYYVKQLALHGVMDLLRGSLRIENAITVG
jgi:hypothetical protein